MTEANGSELAARPTFEALADQIRQRDCAPAGSFSKSVTNDGALLLRATRGVPQATEDKCPPGLLDAIRSAAAAGDWPVYLHGATGTGKSCAAAVVFRRWLERSARRQPPAYPLWVSFPEFCDLLGQIRREHVVVLESVVGSSWECNEHDWWKRWSRPEVVVIDEIGTRSQTDMRSEALWRLLDIRKGLPTIFTGNMGEEEIERVFDERILSRLLEGTWIEVAGPDRRASGAARRTIKIGG